MRAQKKNLTKMKFKEFTNTKKFIKHLIDQHVFNSDHDKKYIYRGQGDSTWDLLPSLHRSLKQLLFLDDIRALFNSDDKTINAFESKNIEEVGPTCLPR